MQAQFKKNITFMICYAKEMVSFLKWFDLYDFGQSSDKLRPDMKLKA